MKRWLLALSLIVPSLAMADDKPGFYKELHYRQNDPFLFCTEGQLDPSKCWSPLDPISGTYVNSPWCQPVMEYGKPWTNDDYRSLGEYQAVCPQAMSKGAWEGIKPANMTPTVH